MRITTNWARGTTALSRLSPELAARAKQRLRWIGHLEKHGSKSLTCRYFGISRPALDERPLLFLRLHDDVLHERTTSQNTY